MGIEPDRSGHLQQGEHRYYWEYFGKGDKETVCLLNGLAMHTGTAEAIRDGWLWTGDLAVRDDEGFYTIKGRSKDMFISGGENVYPAEVESLMLAYPGIAEAALVGVPHPKWGEVGKACLVLEPGADFSEEDFRAFLGERLARYKLPRTIELLDELPKTAIGKIDKKLLAETG